MRIRTEKDYLKACERVKKAKTFLKGKFLDPEYQGYVKIYEKITTAMLRYELDNNLIDI